MAPTSSPPPYTIRPAAFPADLPTITTLFTAYATSLNLDLSFQDFAHELSSLPGKYTTPDGIVLIAERDRHHHSNERRGESESEGENGIGQQERVLGCVALRPLILDDAMRGEDEGRRFCEMKRLYVVPAGRGLGLGRALAEAIIEVAKGLRYETIRLDTLASMQAAKKVYTDLGFVECEKYYDTPIKGTVFLELNLR